MRSGSKWLFGAILMMSRAASGYLVANTPSLADVEKEAAVVVKATAVHDAAVADPHFPPLMGFEVRETTLKVVSVLKGPALTEFRFRHYAQKKDGPVAGYSPLTYDLLPGRSYVVFAKKEKEGVYQPLWDRHFDKDQGLYLAADARPPTAKGAVEVVLQELLALAKSEVASDAVYAIRELDSMSGNRTHSLHDFDRGVAIQAIAARLDAKSPEISAAAISALGLDSPYVDDNQAQFWLAGKPGSEIQGVAALTPSGKNPLADANRAALLKVANGDGAAPVRALAIRALGRGVPSAAFPDQATWLKDPDPLVRQAAVTVLADVPGEASNRAIAAASKDAAAPVRVGAARAIGFGQIKSLLPTLGQLLSDPDRQVRMAAGLSLMSFDIENSRAVLTAHLDSDFRAIFVNALARKEPKPFLPDLGEVVEKQLSPQDFWGGRVVAADAWDILFKYVKAQPASDLKSGRLDSTLNALESMRWFSSSEPRALYALYLARGLPERARRFRATGKNLEGLDMNTYFDMADKDPALYLE
jgi:hypothetical protein